MGLPTLPLIILFADKQVADLCPSIFYLGAVNVVKLLFILSRHKNQSGVNIAQIDHLAVVDASDVCFFMCLFKSRDCLHE